MLEKIWSLKSHALIIGYQINTKLKITIILILISNHSGMHSIWKGSQSPLFWNPNRSYYYVHASSWLLKKSSCIFKNHCIQVFKKLCIFLFSNNISSQMSLFVSELTSESSQLIAPLMTIVHKNHITLSIFPLWYISKYLFWMVTMWEKLGITIMFSSNSKILSFCAYMVLSPMPIYNCSHCTSGPPWNTLYLFSVHLD